MLMIGKDKFDCVSRERLDQHFINTVISFQLPILTYVSIRQESIFLDLLLKKAGVDSNLIQKDSSEGETKAVLDHFMSHKHELKVLIIYDSSLKKISELSEIDVAIHYNLNITPAFFNQRTKIRPNITQLFLFTEDLTPTIQLLYSTKYSKEIENVNRITEIEPNDEFINWLLEPEIGRATRAIQVAFGKKKTKSTTTEYQLYKPQYEEFKDVDGYRFKLNSPFKTSCTYKCMTLQCNARFSIRKIANTTIIQRKPIIHSEKCIESHLNSKERDERNYTKSNIHLFVHNLVESNPFIHPVAVHEKILIDYQLAPKKYPVNSLLSKNYIIKSMEKATPLRRISLLQPGITSEMSLMDDRSLFIHYHSGLPNPHIIIGVMKQIEDGKRAKSIVLCKGMPCQSFKEIIYITIPKKGCLIIIGVCMYENSIVETFSDSMIGIKHLFLQENSNCQVIQYPIEYYYQAKRFFQRKNIIVSFPYSAYLDLVNQKATESQCSVDNDEFTMATAIIKSIPLLPSGHAYIQRFYRLDKIHEVAYALKLFDQLCDEIGAASILQSIKIKTIQVNCDLKELEQSSSQRKNQADIINYYKKWLTNKENITLSIDYYGPSNSLGRYLSSLEQLLSNQKDVLLLKGQQKSDAKKKKSKK